MVDEFSAFARMPQPEMKDENLSEICRQAVFLERNRNPGIDFASDLPDEDARLVCDSRQVGRALTNVLKNAAESVAGRVVDAGSASGKVDLAVKEEPAADGSRTVIVVEDNGRGLPKTERGRLTEPYVTTREKGTGLGLAIVKKIMEDHGGDLVLDDRNEGGARVSLVFGLVDKDLIAGSAENEDPDPMKVATGTLLHDA
jgi:two-component system nitrogen regulation sensor histidine kinase NtrY